MDVMKAYTDIIKENIEYEYLLRDNPYKKDVIEEILNLIVETVSVKRKTVRIAGANYPYEVVKGKLLKLDTWHIQYVLDCMDKFREKHCMRFPKKRYRSCYYTKKSFADWFAEKMMFPLGCVIFAVVGFAGLNYFDLLWYMW